MLVMVEEATSLEVPVKIPAIEIISDIGNLHALDTKEEERVTKATVLPGEVSHYDFILGDGKKTFFFILIGDPDGGGTVFLVTGPDGKEPVESLFQVGPGETKEIMANVQASGLDLSRYRQFEGRLVS